MIDRGPVHLNGLVRTPIGRAARNRPCRIARRPGVRCRAGASIAFYGPARASEGANLARFGDYYRISPRSIPGGPHKRSLKPLPDTTGMLSGLPRFFAISRVGLRTLANCHCDAKIPMAIG